MRITSNKQLKALCDELLAKVTLYKNKAIEVVDTTKEEDPRYYKKHVLYIVARRGALNWQSDHVAFTELTSGDTCYTINGCDGFGTSGENLTISFNGYKYTNKKGHATSDVKKREILLNLKSELDKLFNN